MQRRAKKSTEVATLILSLIIPSAWLIYHSISLFHDLALTIPLFIENLREKNLFSHVFVLGQTYTGPQVPLWANLTRVFWWLTIYIFGSVLALRDLISHKNLSTLRIREAGGYLGLFY